MGANLSRVEDSRVSVAPPPSALSHAVSSPKYHRRDSENNNLKFPNNNKHYSISIEIKDSEAAASSAPSVTPNKYHYYKSSAASSNSNRPSIPPPAAALVPSSKAAKVHRVIYFHSSPSCRGYLEASKASNTLIHGWSGCCRYMEPILDEFAAKYTNVDFLKINVDELYDLSCEYGVQTTPTFLLMKRGKLLDKVTEPSTEEFQKKIEKIGFKHSSNNCC